jgi:hypothetical protein
VSTYRPIQQRVGELIRSKKEKLHHLWIQNQTENPDLTFKPKISKVSKQLAEQNPKRQDRPVVDRLVNDFKEISEKKAKLQEKVEKQIFHEYTFTPQVDANSDRIITERFHGDQTFFERQKVYHWMRFYR